MAARCRFLRRRLAAGEEVARMYQEPGLDWPERQAEVAEDLLTTRRPADQQHDRTPQITTRCS